MTDIVQIMMDAEEARDCIDQINENLKDTRELLWELYERKGWKALGYDSWRTCVTSEFKAKQAYLYCQLAAAKVEKNVSTVVEKTPIGQIPERVLRPLSRIKDPEEQREIYRKAVETAPEGKITAKHVENTIKDIHAEKTDDKGFVNNDSPNLSSVKTMWNACNKGDKIKFIRWVRKYFQGYLTKERGEEPTPKVDKWKNIRSEPELMSNEFRAALDSMQRVLYNESGTRWKTTSREVAEKYINQLLRMTEK